MKLTKEKINQLKAKYGQIFLIQISIPGTDKTADFVVRYPSKTEMEALSAQSDVAAYNDLMFNFMIVEGDRQYIDDTDQFSAPVYLALVNELGKLYQPPSVSLKTL